MFNQKLSENYQWILLWFILVLTSIYARPLMPIDETRYLSVAWEMWQSNDFLVPHINGQPYSHKPPLLFWLINLSWLLFGVGEWPGRMVGPLFGLGSLMLTVRLAGILWPSDRDVRQTAPFVLLGTCVWSLFSSLTMFDTLLTFCTLTGFWATLEASRKKSMLPWAGVGLSIGMGILAKGPIIILYIAPPILFVSFWCRSNTHTLKQWYGYSFGALLVGLGIAACWAIPAALAGGKQYEQAILFSQTAGRMVQAFAHGRPFYWYIALIPFICLPWFFWLPAWRGWKRKKVDYSVRFCLSAVLPPLILLSAVSGKQVHYVLPILPICSLLVARITTKRAKWTIIDGLPLLLFFLALTIGLIVIPQLSLSGGDTEMVQFLPRWLWVVPALCGSVFFFAKAHSVRSGIKVVSASMLMLVILIQLSIAAPLHNIYDQTEVGEKIRKIQERGGVVAVFPANLADQFQFAGKLADPVLPLGSAQEITAWAKANPQQFCLIFSKYKVENITKIDGMIKRFKDGWLFFLSAKSIALSSRESVAGKT